MDLNIRGWKKYFEERGVLLDVEYAKFLLASFRKLRKKGDVDEAEKREMKRKETIIENLFFSSREFLEGDYLEIRDFLSDLDKLTIKIYPRYELSDTYRMVTKDPAIGNLDEVLKKLIVPRQGYVLVSIDYKNQEPWIMANILKNKELLYLLESFDDFYVGILEKFGVEVSLENREKVKKLWNATVYGSALNEKEAIGDEWIKDIYYWINEMEEIKNFKDYVTRELKENGYIENEFGLRRTLSYNGNHSIRQAFNSIFQMSGAVVLYAGLENINNAVINGGLQGKIDIYLTNHDEYLLEVSNQISKEDLLEFLFSISFGIPEWTKPRLHVRIGRNWGDLRGLNGYVE